VNEILGHPGLSAPLAATRATRPRAFGLDVCRALAALGVLVTHVAFATGLVAPERWSSPLRQVLPRLDVGVTIFFVLSGLLVSRPFLRRLLEDAPAPAMRGYAIRRLSRIYPVYWVALGVTLITVGRGGWGQTVADLLLVHIYVPRWAIGPITQSWSLATEVAFYAFLPLWFAGMRRLLDRTGVADPRRRARWCLVALLSWVGVAALYRVVVVMMTDTYDIGVVGAVDVRGALLTWLPNHLDAFAAGVALAVLLEAGRARPMKPFERITCYATAAAALWIASAHLGLPPVFTGFDATQSHARHLLFLVVAVGVVAPSALAMAGESASRWRPTVPGATQLATGAAMASYGVYLWHQWVTTEWFTRQGYPAFQAPFLRTFAVVLAGSTALAALTYWLVERPATTLATGRGGGTPVVPPRSLDAQPRLDGLRGLAILAVLGTHVVFLDGGSYDWALRGGFLGVDVFLALSAFLIGAVLLRELDRTGGQGKATIDGGDFARRRARRLYPPLIAFLAIEGVVAVAIGTGLGEQLFQSVLALTFTANLQLGWGHQPPYELVHLWSLSLEAQFYVLMALGLWWARDRIRRPERVVAALLLGSVVVAMWRLWLYRHGVALEALYERPDARLDSMFLGVAAALVWRSRLVSERALRIGGAVAAVALAVALVVATPTSSWLFEGGFTLVALAAAAVVASVAEGTGAVAAVGGLRPLRWFGAISYSLYLWHLPVYLWTVRAMPEAPLGVKVLVAVGASTTLAWLSFRFVEASGLAAWRRREA
jgi:peptidoglycan/LPS O-acetylase OafA/YrhL